LERGELSKSHGTALLVAEDPQVRSRLAREAIERGWSTRTLEARARESNMEEGERGREGGLDSAHAQARNETAMNIARVWGDALGAEVTVRPLPARKFRVEFVFDSPEGAFALGGQIAEQIARGSKRRH
jgi:ParB family transcriptional regulator, chromosome partitioning protein